MDFATREEVINDGLGQLPSALPRHRLTLHVQLAWHLRQRDTRAALAHADAAAALLADASAGEQASAIARLQLVRGEAAWLGGDLAEALRFAEAADPANAAASPPSSAPMPNGFAPGSTTNSVGWPNATATASTPPTRRPARAIDSGSRW